MGITTATYKKLIPLELGDTTGLVSGNIDRLWELYSEWHSFPLVHFTLVKIQAIKLLIGEMVKETGTITPLGQRELSDNKRGDRLRELNRMLREAQLELKSYQRQTSMVVVRAMKVATDQQREFRY
jgi:hypothetical protein